jgi:FkbM family methyltransferase
MTTPFLGRPIAYVLAATDHGPMIVNRNDEFEIPAEGGTTMMAGVGYELLHSSHYSMGEMRLYNVLLAARRKYFGDGVVALDGGANIGVFTIEWARLMYGWGRVMAFEPQEFVFYALAGNIALNNLLNATARNAALGAECGTIEVPEPDYFKRGSFGSLELRQTPTSEHIGQDLPDASGRNFVGMVTIDSLELARVDLLKLDVENMEIEALQGARETISRCQPIVIAEALKCGRLPLQNFLTPLDYRVFPFGANIIAIHSSDPTLGHVRERALESEKQDV